MQYKTTFKTIPLADIVECPYNPRVAIERDTPEYDALRRSLEQHEVVEPLVVNIHNMRCVGGNQRLAVMRDMGLTEALCSIIDQPDEVQEKKLCLALNRIDGRWDTDKLGDLLRDDDVLEWETGFDEAEVRLYRQLEDAHEPDADDDAEDLDEDTVMRTLPRRARSTPRSSASATIPSRSSIPPTSAWWTPSWTTASSLGRTSRRRSRGGCWKMIELVPIESVHASEYNPRRNDEKRLALTELSLRKLGFLLPIYADRSGEILSGHQRHLVASRMGFTQIPVDYVSGKDLGERKAVNVLFNRATNDLQKQDTCDIIRRRLYEMDVESMVDGLPDITPDTVESFPCVFCLHRRDTVQLAKANHRSFDTHTRQLAKSLERRIGTAMPIVIGASENVINGIGRLQVAAEAKRPVVRCVVVTKEQEAFATAMLNLLSMDFDIASYADDLRYNSFMRERNTRETDAEGNAALGDGFFKGVFPKNRGRDFCKLEGAALETWRRHYGSSVVDFGAGKLNNTRTLRKAGIQVSAFEPYFVTVGEKIHKEKSLEIAARFLDEVEAGTPYSSVFISSVFNSVPFMADRKQIAVIAAALCAPDGMVVCWCQSNKAPQFVNTKKKFLAAEKVLTFDLDYEPNTILGDIGAHPKVQKGHTEEEMWAIFAPCFRTVKRLEMITKFWYMEAADPIVDPAALAAALDFEFELPYPDGSRMGLSQRAREAFEHRLGIRLPPPTKGEAK